MFIVSFPYSVLEGGYWALVSMVVVAWVCCYTGKILIDCLYEDDVVTEPRTDDDGRSRGERVQRRVRGSYVEIAAAVWGSTVGGRVVFLAQLIELLMTCILYVLLCGELMVGVFPSSPLDLTAWILISGGVLLPCALLRSLRHVAWLSFWCTVAHMIVNGVIIVYCFTRVFDWHWRAVQLRVDIWTFPISFGMVIFSYTSQIFLPSMEGNMDDRSHFDTMLDWTHLAAAVFKVLFSYIGFLTFGDNTQEVITNNLPNQALKTVVNLCLVAKALLSYPLPYFAAVELFEAAMFRGRPDTILPSCYDPSPGGSLRWWAVVLRLTVVVLTILMAIFVPHFAILMGLIGSFTGNMLSLVWPAYFHLRIKGTSVGVVRRAVDVFIVLFGLICSGIGIYYSAHALVWAYQGREPRPFQTP